MFGQAIITVPAKRALQAGLAFRQSSIDTFDTSQLSQVTTGGSCPAGDDFAAVEVAAGIAPTLQASIAAGLAEATLVGATCNAGLA